MTTTLNAVANRFDARLIPAALTALITAHLLTQPHTTTTTTTLTVLTTTTLALATLTALTITHHTTKTKPAQPKKLTTTLTQHTCLIACAATLTATPCALTKHHHHTTPLHTTLTNQTHTTFTATITNHPTTKTTQHTTKTTFTATIKTITTPNQTTFNTHTPAALNLAPTTKITPTLGQTWQFRGKLTHPTYNTRNQATATITSGQLITQAPTWAHTSHTQRQKLKTLLTNQPPTAALTTGLLIGDTSNLTPTQHEHLNTAGLTHLVAVSGGNMVIIATLALLLTTLLGLPPPLRNLTAATTILAYTTLVGPDSSVLRATTMSLITLLAIATGKTRTALATLSIATIGLLTYNPKFSHDYGFLLSLAATTALLTCLHQVTARWNHLTARATITFIATPALATLACTPLTLTLTGTLATYALPANLIASWTAPIAMTSGTLALTTMNWSPHLATICIQPATWTSHWILTTAHTINTLPHPTITLGATPTTITLATLTSWGTLATTLWLTPPKTQPKTPQQPTHKTKTPKQLILTLITTTATLTAIIQGTKPPHPPPPNTWLIHACDVGQGTAILIHTKPGHAILADTGPPNQGLTTCLKNANITTIDLLILSHYHLDHVGALNELITNHPTTTIWTTAYKQPQQTANAITHTITQAGIPHTTPPQNHTTALGNATVRVLGNQHLRTDPHQNLAPRRGATQPTGTDINNASLTVTITVNGLTVLLPGDAEIAAQRHLLSLPKQGSHDPLKADVLIVPHHGSAKQLPELFHRVQPQVAIVTAGRQNDYGHPARRALNMLARSGTPVRRTDQCGHLSIGDHRGDDSVWVHSTNPTC